MQDGLAVEAHDRHLVGWHSVGRQEGLDRLGMDVGDQVVVDGAGYLSDGEPVFIATASAE